MKIIKLQCGMVELNSPMFRLSPGVHLDRIDECRSSALSQLGWEFSGQVEEPQWETAAWSCDANSKVTMPIERKRDDGFYRERRRGRICGCIEDIVPAMKVKKCRSAKIKNTADPNLAIERVGQLSGNFTTDYLELLEVC